LSGIDESQLETERDDYGQVVLVGRLRDALTRINPGVPDDAIEEALCMVTRPDSPSLIVNNRAFHRMIPGREGEKTRLVMVGVRSSMIWSGSWTTTI